jgi:hypothetical protein
MCFVGKDAEDVRQLGFKVCIEAKSGMCTNLGTGARACSVPFLRRKSIGTPDFIVLMGQNIFLSWLPQPCF